MNFFYNFNITICNKLATMLLSSISAPLPLFQSKVADCLIRMGSLAAITDYLLQNQIDQTFSVIGQQLYLTHIRPVCVDRQYLYKKLPTLAQLNNQNQQTKYFAKIETLKEQRNIRPSLKIYQQTQQSGQQKQSIENKKAPKKGSKAYQNSTKERQQEFKKKAINQKFFNDLDFAMSSHSRDLLQVEFGLSHKIMQIKLITFFYIRWFIDYNFPLERVSYQDIYQFISILIKVIKTYEKFVGPKYQLKHLNEQKQEIGTISSTLILDMKVTLIYLIKKYQYGNMKILLNYPRLAYDNRYNKFFPNFDIKPYLSQIQLVNYIRSSLDLQAAFIKDPKIIIYNTMVGAGKTSVVLALNKLATIINKDRQQNERIKILYACELQSVSIQLARLAYQKLGSFALAKDKTIKYGKKQIQMTQLIKQSQNKNSQTDLIIADWKSAYNILDKHEISQEEQKIIEQFEKQNLKTIKVGKLQPQNTILFVDQPTIQCYSTDSPQTNQLFQILADRPPKIIVLASATMPHIQQLQTTFNLVKKIRPNLVVQQVKSKQFQIGCEFYTFTQQIFYPHTGVKNKEQLLNVVNKINQNPFLMRFYTGTTLFLLIKQLQSRGIKIPDQLDLSGYSTSITYRDFPAVTNKVLTILSKQSDQIIQEVCQLNNLELQKQIKKFQQNKSRQQFQQFFDFQLPADKQKQTEKCKQTKQIDFSKIIKEDSHKFLGGCLIATSDPVEFSLKYFQRWVKNVPKIKVLRQYYQQNQQNIQQQLQFIRGKAGQQKIKQKSKKQSIFPAHLKINTLYHYNYFKGKREIISEQKQRLNRSKIILSNSFKDIQHFFDGQVDETILKLLLCGIGIYAESGLPKSYLEKVQQLASLNRLAFIISDKSLCFGVNFPISNVVILDNLGTKLSWNQIFQLIGRAGRVGRSWAARCYVEDETKKRLFRYIQSDDRKNGQQGLVFQQLGKYYINNPEFKLRTLRTQIRQNKQLLNLNSHPSSIEINIYKDRVEDKCLRISKIVLFIRNATNKSQAFALKTSVKSRKQSQKYITYFQFPHSPIIFEDIPTINNSQEISIIDVESYYRNQNQFIHKIIENARNRLLSTHFNPQQIQKMASVNKFDVQKFQKYHSNSTQTLCLFMEYQGDELLNHKPNAEQQAHYKFEKIYLNPIKYTPKLTQKMLNRLNTFSNACQNLIPIVYKNPSQILFQDIKIIRESVQYIKRKKNLQIYFQFMNQFAYKLQKDLKQITKQIQNKQSLLYLQQFKVIVLIQKYIDLQNIGNPMFSIDKQIRDVQQIVQLMGVSDRVKVNMQEQGDGYEYEQVYEYDQDTQSEKQEEEIVDDGQQQNGIEGVAEGWQNYEDYQYLEQEQGQKQKQEGQKEKEKYKQQQIQQIEQTTNKVQMMSIQPKLIGQVWDGKIQVHVLPQQQIQQQQNVQQQQTDKHKHNNNNNSNNNKQHQHKHQYQDEYEYDQQQQQQDDSYQQYQHDEHDEYNERQRNSRYRNNQY